MIYTIGVFNLHKMQKTTETNRFFEFEIDAIDYCKKNSGDSFVYLILEREFN